MAKDNEFFEGLHNAMAEGLDALRKGKPLTTREVVLPDRPKPMSARQIAGLRRELCVSQAVFASMTNAAVQTVQAWEQGRTKPAGPALRLLRLIKEEPKIVTRMLRLA